MTVMFTFVGLAAGFGLGWAAGMARAASLLRQYRGDPEFRARAERVRAEIAAGVRPPSRRFRL